MSLFPVAHDHDGLPAEPDASAGGAPTGVQDGFSSFNAAAFLQEQQKPSSVAQEGLSGQCNVALLSTFRMEHGARRMAHSPIN